MPYFKDNDGNVHYLDDVAFVSLLPSGCTPITDDEAAGLQAPAPLTADDLWVAIKAERDRRSEAGCLVAGHWFHNDLKSRTQWERMANRSTALADADPYLVDGVQVAWKTMSGAFVPLTVGLIRQVVDAFEVQEVAMFKAAEIHRVAMEASADPASYNFSGSWPPVYEV